MIYSIRSDLKQGPFYLDGEGEIDFNSKNAKEITTGEKTDKCSYIYSMDNIMLNF